MLSETLNTRLKRLNYKKGAAWHVACPMRPCTVVACTKKKGSRSCGGSGRGQPCNCPVPCAPAPLLPVQGRRAAEAAAEAAEARLVAALHQAEQRGCVAAAALDNLSAAEQVQGGAVILHGVGFRGSGFRSSGVPQFGAN